jgi:hypothetical protein
MLSDPAEQGGGSGTPVGKAVGDEVTGDPVGEVVGVEVEGGMVVGDEVVGEPEGEVVGDDVIGVCVGDSVLSQLTTTFPATKMDGPASPHPVFRNAFSPIDETDAGMVSVVIPDCWNAPSPMHGIQLRASFHRDVDEVDAL